MGAPKVSRAILTMSMARTTPAQKPRGLRRSTRLSTAESFLRSRVEIEAGIDSKAVEVTLLVYQSLNQEGAYESDSSRLLIQSQNGLFARESEHGKRG